MNAYSFPDHVTISEQAKTLITRILNLDPSKRPVLEEILEHPFFHMGNAIPKLLPASTLACPPSASYVRQFMPSQNITKNLANQKLPSPDTVPLQGISKHAVAANDKIDKMKTDRIPKQGFPQGIGKPSTANPEYKKKDSDNDRKGPNVWVKKWVDYSSKYGLGKRN